MYILCMHLFLKCRYEQQYNYESANVNPEDPPHCVDVDECQIGTSTCDIHAVCINYPGSYRCECPPGHSGDGYTCTSKTKCKFVLQTDADVYTEKAIIKMNTLNLDVYLGNRNYDLH